MQHSKGKWLFPQLAVLLEAWLWVFFIIPKSHCYKKVNVCTLGCFYEWNEIKSSAQCPAHSKQFTNGSFLAPWRCNILNVPITDGPVTPSRKVWMVLDPGVHLGKLCVWQEGRFNSLSLRLMVVLFSALILQIKEKNQRSLNVLYAIQSRFWCLGFNYTYL